MPTRCRHYYFQAARSNYSSALLPAMRRRILGRSRVQDYVESRLSGIGPSWGTDIACLWHKDDPDHFHPCSRSGRKQSGQEFAKTGWQHHGFTQIRFGWRTKCRHRRFTSLLGLLIVINIFIENVFVARRYRRLQLLDLLVQEAVRKAYRLKFW